MVQRPCPRIVTYSVRGLIPRLTTFLERPPRRSLTTLDRVLIATTNVGRSIARRADEDLVSLLFEWSWLQQQWYSSCWSWDFSSNATQRNCTEKLLRLRPLLRMLVRSGQTSSWLPPLHRPLRPMTFPPAISHLSPPHMEVRCNSLCATERRQRWCFGARSQVVRVKRCRCLATRPWPLIQARTRL